MFVVNEFLQERFPSITKKPMLFKAIGGTLRYLLHESEFRNFGKKYPHLDGIDFVEQVLDYFDFSYQLSNRDRERVPVTGKVVIVANHPIGSLDGLALIQMVHQVRSDVKILANDMLSSIKPLDKLLLPVNNMGGNTPKQNINRINNHLNDGGAIILFPAGEVSRIKLSGVKDGRWSSGFLKIAKMAKAPILPIYVKARNSAAFYVTSMVYKPLATLLLVKEMIKQSHKTVTIKVGNAIPFSSYRDVKLPQKEVVKLFYKHLYRIGSNKSEVFETEVSIAHPENPCELHEHLNHHEIIGTTPDEKVIYLCKDINDSPILREIGRLREISFREVGEGSGLKRDTDQYDRYYYHLVLWDKVNLEIVGAYRFCDVKTVIENHGRKGLYTDTLFDFMQSMDSYFPQALELGRSFVQPKYWGKRSLDYLWFGIGAFIKKNPHFRYLFGPVSLSDQIPSKAKSLLIYFYQLYFGSSKAIARSKNPFMIDESVIDELKETFTGDDYRGDFVQLKSMLSNMGVSIPTLYKQYTELCEDDGVKFLDFGIDPAFSGCVDGLVLVDLIKLKDKKRSRYLS
ncbi:MAG: lysophospholipid acyltransferase family protein [Kangiellaceae bacterium]|jgi:putative hemolysin|nr:lysophospholipid acyltransferase family protein [Kangiellaceae bacterium]